MKFSIVSSRYAVICITFSIAFTAEFESPSLKPTSYTYTSSIVAAFRCQFRDLYRKLVVEILSLPELASLLL